MDWKRDLVISFLFFTYRSKHPCFDAYKATTKRPPRAPSPWINYATTVGKQSTTVGTDPTTVAEANLVQARVSRAKSNDFDDDAVCNKLCVCG